MLPYSKSNFLNYTDPGFLKLICPWPGNSERNLPRKWVHTINTDFLKYQICEFPLPLSDHQWIMTNKLTQTTWRWHRLFTDITIEAGLDLHIAVTLYMFCFIDFINSFHICQIMLSKSQCPSYKNTRLHTVVAVSSKSYSKRNFNFRSLDLPAMQAIYSY